MEKNDLSRASEELLQHSAEDVVFEPHIAQGREIRGHDELREFWSRFAEEGLQLRAGAYSIARSSVTAISVPRTAPPSTAVRMLGKVT